MSPASRTLPYELEQLFVDQDPDWVIDTIAPVLAWIPGKSKQRAQQPFRFDVDHTCAGKVEQVHVDLRWDVTKLASRVLDLKDRVRRFRTGRTAHREHITELAAYGLTFVAISLLMPKRRVKLMRMGQSPDILFDVTPGKLRGVETAGRATGGRAALRVVRDGTPAGAGKPAKAGKAQKLKARTDLAEVHLSLWCASPRLGMMEELER